MTHNEALGLIDMTMQLVVESADLATPPPAPTPGQCWIVAAGSTGAWADQAGAVAGWTVNGWLFVAPGAGWRAWAIDRGHCLRHNGVTWADEAVRADGFYIDGQRVIGERQAAIVAPSGGVTQDTEARVALASILAVLRAHGLIDA